VSGMDPLNTYWNPNREDNFTTATEAGRVAAQASGYFFARNEGWVPRSDLPAPDPVQNYASLDSFWNAERGDNFLTATDAGRSAARSAGYLFVRREGWTLIGGGPAPLQCWWNSRRQDNYTTGMAEGVHASQAAGYVFVRNEGYLWNQPSGLCLFWDERRGDNFTAGSREGYLAAAAAGYRFIRGEFGPSQQAPGTVPLKLYWNGEREDNFTLAHPESEAAARTAGYVFVRNEAWVYPNQSSIPSNLDVQRELRSYWNSTRQDHILAIQGEETERTARSAGYELLRVEGYVASRNPG
jgi:hypothetical protein